MRVVITDNDGNVLDTITDMDRTDYKPDGERDDRESFLDRCRDSIEEEFDRQTRGKL